MGNFPTLFIYRTHPAAFGSLWLKTVDAVDLTVHCIDSLIGQRIRVDPKADDQAIPITVPARAYYLCGLPYPYRWEQNSHLLAVPAPGEEHEWGQPSFDVVLADLRPVPITPDWIDPADPHAEERLFATCRNWQAAWQLHREFGLANRPNPDRKTRRRPKKATTGKPKQRSGGGRGDYEGCLF
jgi:hypothetical protein